MDPKPETAEKKPVSTNPPAKCSQARRVQPDYTLPQRLVVNADGTPAPYDDQWTEEADIEFCLREIKGNESMAEHQAVKAKQGEDFVRRLKNMIWYEERDIKDHRNYEESHRFCVKWLTGKLEELQKIEGEKNKSGEEDKKNKESFQFPQI